MAKISISYKCGHEGTEQRGGNRSDRDSYAEWAGQHKVCGDCYQAERERERGRAAEAASAANAASGLPALEGSPKQVAWAESIREPVCEALRGVDFEVLWAKGAPAEIRAEVADAKILLEDEIRGQASAGWWIDERDGACKSIQRHAARWVYNTAVQRGLTPALSAWIREREEKKQQEQRDV